MYLIVQGWEGWNPVTKVFIKVHEGPLHNREFDIMPSALFEILQNNKLPIEGINEGKINNFIVHIKPDPKTIEFLELMKRHLQ